MKLSPVSVVLFVAFVAGIAAPATHAQIIFQSNIETIDDDGIAEVMEFSSDGMSEVSGVLSSLGLGGAKRLPNDTSRLLRLPQIRNELKLGDDQVQAIGKLSKVMTQQMSDVFRSVDFGSGDTRKIMQEAQRTIREKTQEKLEELLTPRQLDRLKQIKVQSALQQKGALAALTGEVGEQINLSDKQKTHLRQLHTKKKAELEAEIEALRERYRKETLAEVLTESQLKDLEQISGDPYEIKKPKFMSMVPGLQSKIESIRDAAKEKVESKSAPAKD